MLKGSLFVFLYSCGFLLKAQNPPVFNITTSVLQAGSIAPKAVQGYSLNAGILALFLTANVRSNAAALNTTPVSTRTIPIGLFTARAIESNAPPFFLSTNDQGIASANLGLLGLGSWSFTVEYALPNISTNAWQAGTYSVPLIYSFTGVTLGGGLTTPPNPTITVNVSPFINPQIPPNDVELLLNDLNYFRNTSLFPGNPTSYLHTVPLKINLKGNTTQFAFTNGYANVPSPVTSIGRVRVQTTTPAGDITALSTSGADILPSTAVPIGNLTSVTTQYTISPADALAGFINMGTYTTTMTLEAKDGSGGATTSGPKTLNLKVTVSDLAAININTATINLKLQTAADYKNGVYVDVPNHLVVSKTTPYTVTVKADDSNLKLGATYTIPSSILSIGPAAGQTGVNSISSLTTSPQTLVSSSMPAIDRKNSIRYSIDATKTPGLLNKTAGIYTTTVTYTVTAL
jgi:hypothetical protein